MKHIAKTSTLALLATLLCTACDPIPELETKKAQLLEQLQKCSTNEGETKTEQAEKLKECQFPLINALQEVDQEIYKAKFGKGYKLEYYSHNYWLAFSGNQFTILDPNGNPVTDSKYENFAEIKTKRPLIEYPLPPNLNIPDYYFEDSRYLFPVIYLKDSNENWGAINLETGKEVVPFKYAMPELYLKNRLAYALDENKDNYQILLSEYDKNYKKSNYILVNHLGEVILSLDDNQDFTILDQDNKFIQIEKEGKTVLLKDQKPLISLDGEVSFSILKGHILARTYNPEKVKVYSFEGGLLFEADYLYTKTFSDSADIIYISVPQGASRLINRSGQVLFDNLESIRELNEKYLIVTNNKDKEGIIDYQGNLILDFEYEEFRSFEEHYNVITFRKNNKYGVMDMNFNIVIPAIADRDYAMLSKNYTLLRNNETEGLYLLNGVQILPPIYDSVYKRDKFIQVEKDGKTAMFSLEGKPITKFIYDVRGFHILNEEPIEPYFPHGVISACRSRKCGIIDLNGKEIIPFKYDEISFNKEDNTFKVELNNKKGKLDITGKPLKETK